MSAAFPDVQPQMRNVSPLLAEAAHENLHYFTKLNKTLVELIQRVTVIHDEAANNVLATVDLFGKKMNEITKSKHCGNDSFVKFINRVLEQMTSQASTLKSLGSSFNDCVVSPLQNVVEKKKEVWKTCFHYTQTFQDQIRKKEDDLIKRHKDYADAANKLKSTTDQKTKLQLIYNNAHNTYLLRLSSVNSINNLLYTHVLPHVLFALEKNQAELNDSLRHHMKYMFSVQKDMLKKLIKSVDKIDHATDKIDIVVDFKKFIKSTVKAGLKDWTPPIQSFTGIARNDQSKGNQLVDLAEDSFIVNKLTQPNLHRRLASLQYQTNQIVDSISSMRAGESQEINEYLRSDDEALNELIELLCICDKEANLNVLLKQMELYSPDILEYLGPPPDNILDERKHTKTSPIHQTSGNSSINGQKPHEFIETRLIKPLTCYYCSRIISLIGKGFTCKTCKMSVHKKCATNVPFCTGTPIIKKKRSKSTTDAYSLSVTSDEQMMKPENSTVYDLIDLEGEDSDDYYDDDEFDDGLSDEHDDDDDDDDNDNRHHHHRRHQKEQAKPPQHRHSISTSTVGYNTPVLKPAVLQKPITTPKNRQKPNSTPPLAHPKPSKSKHNPQHRLSMPILPVKIQQQLPLKPTVSTKPGVSAKPTRAKKPSVSKKPSLPPTPARELQNSFCVALYDYQVTQESDLCLTAGTKIKLLEKSNADWWKGEIGYQTGYFPSTYVLEVKETDTILSVLYDFFSEDAKELSVEKDQILILLECEDDWYKVRSCNGEGLVPIAYVQPF